MHVKKDTTTAASIKITCFRYLRKLLRLLCAEIIDGLAAIKCLAIIVYSPIKIRSGRMKKIMMLLMKKTDVQNVSAAVKQTGTCEFNYNSTCTH